MQFPGLITFKTAAEEGPWRYGLQRNGAIVELSRLGFNSDINELLRRGRGALDELFSKAEKDDVPWLESPSPSEVVFGPPVPSPDKILCVGLNYRAHAKEAGLRIPEMPVIFAKFKNSLTGNGAAIEIPDATSEVDYEGELAVVIGRRCRNVSVEDALSMVAGYSVFNDLTARDLQRAVSQWTLGKAVDGFAPMGPSLVPSAFIPNPQDLELVTRVNGRVVQQANTSDMIFSISEIIFALTRVITLEPGDIIATGTPSGVGSHRNPPSFLRSGDVVEVEIMPLGTLTNSIV